MSMDLNKFLDKFFKGNTKKLVINFLIILLVGVLLILIGNITSNLTSKKTQKDDKTVEVTTNSTTADSTANYEEKIKKELVDTLSQMAGVGKVSVMIYFDGGSQSLPAVNINDTSKKTDEKDTQGGTRVTTESTKNQSIVIITEGNNNRPFIVKQLNPSIGGVIVVAEGAENSELKERIHNAVKTVLNLTSNKVNVVPMKR
jgi:stage III sporulation protein AG